MGGAIRPKRTVLVGIVGELNCEEHLRVRSLLGIREELATSHVHRDDFFVDLDPVNHQQSTCRQTSSGVNGCRFVQGVGRRMHGAAKFTVHALGTCAW